MGADELTVTDLLPVACAPVPSVTVTRNVKDVVPVLLNCNAALLVPTGLKFFVQA